MCQFGAAGMLYPPQNEHQPPLCVCRSRHEHTGAVASAATIDSFAPKFVEYYFQMISDTFPERVSGCEGGSSNNERDLISERR